MRILLRTRGPHQLDQCQLLAKYGKHDPVRPHVAWDSFGWYGHVLDVPNLTAPLVKQIIASHNQFLSAHTIQAYSIPPFQEHDSAILGPGDLDSTMAAIGMTKGPHSDPAFDGGAGSGVIVAWGHLDSGIDETHSGEFCFNDGPAAGISNPAILRVKGKLDLFQGAYPLNPHGTWTAEIVGRSADKNGNWLGGAYRAHIYDARVLDPEGSGDSITVGDGFNYLLKQPIDAINVSLGGPGNDPIMIAALEACWAAGIVVCVAAGNSGNWPPQCNATPGNCACDGSVGSPADANDAMSFAASTAGVPNPADPGGLDPLGIYVQTWSSRGPRHADGSPLPFYLTGPGFAITPGPTDPVNSGTSFSAPHGTASILALIHKLKRTTPGLTKQQIAYTVRQTLFATGVKLGYDKDPAKYTAAQAYCIQGNGLIAVDVAYSQIGGSTPPPPPPPSNRLGLPSQTQVGYVTVKGTQAPNPPPHSGAEATQLDVFLDKQTYNAGDTVTAALGLVFTKDGAPLSGRQVKVMFAGLSSMVNTDQNGSGIATFIAPTVAQDTQEAYQAVFQGD